MVTSVKMPDLSTTSNKLQLSETERSAGQNAKSVDDGLKISLIIRNLADKYGVDLKSISGTGAEIAATAAEEMTEFLIAPIKRIAAPNTPVPFSPVMENFYIPQLNRIISEIRSVCAF